MRDSDHNSKLYGLSSWQNSTFLLRRSYTWSVNIHWATAITWKTNIEHVSNALNNRLILSVGLANKKRGRNLSQVVDYDFDVLDISVALSKIKKDRLIQLSTDLQSWDLFRKKRSCLARVFFLETKMLEECRFNEFCKTCNTWSYVLQLFL